MNHDLRRRILRAETALPGALETLVERGEQYKQRLSSLARIHAFAVAGIALYGQPRIEEPLARAWARTLAYCKENDFLESLEHLSKYFAARESAEREGRSKEAFHKEWNANQKPNRSNEPLSEPIHQSWEDYEEASEGLHRIVPDAQKERLTEKRLTEIFRSAPIWLLSFTLTSIDAKLLDFGLPDLSAAPQFGKIGVRDAWRWPMLPLGVMTEGESVAAEEIDVSGEDCLLTLVTANKPQWEWSRRERLQMLELGERLAGRKIDAALKAKLDSLKRVEELHSKVLKLESAREPLPFTMMLRILGETRPSIPFPIGQYFGRRARTRRQ